MLRRPLAAELGRYVDTMRSVLCLAVLVGASAACGGSKPVPPPVQIRLASADSTVRWVLDSAVVADFDCDGRVDSAFVGRAVNRISVGIVRGSTDSPTVAGFGVHGSAVQEDVGSASASLTLETIDFDPKDDVGDLEGFERSASCKGLNLADGNSDAMHIYWNHKTGALSAWRR